MFSSGSSLVAFSERYFVMIVGKNIHDIQSQVRISQWKLLSHWDKWHVSKAITSITTVRDCCVFFHGSIILAILLHGLFQYYCFSMANLQVCFSVVVITKTVSQLGLECLTKILPLIWLGHHVQPDWLLIEIIMKRLTNLLCSQLTVHMAERWIGSLWWRANARNVSYSLFHGVHYPSQHSIESWCHCGDTVTAVLS